MHGDRCKVGKRAHALFVVAAESVSDTTGFFVGPKTMEAKIVRLVGLGIGYTTFWFVSMCFAESWLRQLTASTKLSPKPAVLHSLAAPWPFLPEGDFPRLVTSAVPHSK